MVGPRFMLDTNIVSATLRGHVLLDERLSQMDPEEWCISAVTRAELRYGLALKPEARSLARLVENFLEVASTIAWDFSAADAHGKLRAHLRQRGTPIGAYDEMIGAHALAEGLTLVTDNTRHFEYVPGLILENWLRASAAKE